MPSNLAELQWKVILKVATCLQDAGIPYHFDASTSLFVHGIEIDMDDVDVSIEWGRFAETRDLFSMHNPTAIFERDGWNQFRLKIEGIEVHFLSAEGMTDLPSHSERNRIVWKDTVLWSKAVEFHRRHMASDHRWASVVDAYLEGEAKKQP